MERWGDRMQRRHSLITTFEQNGSQGTMFQQRDSSILSDPYEDVVLGVE